MSVVLLLFLAACQVPYLTTEMAAPCIDPAKGLIPNCRNSEGEPEYCYIQIAEAAVIRKKALLNCDNRMTEIRRAIAY